MSCDPECPSSCLPLSGATGRGTQESSSPRLRSIGAVLGALDASLQEAQGVAIVRTMVFGMHGKRIPPGEFDFCKAARNSTAPPAGPNWNNATAT